MAKYSPRSKGRLAERAGISAKILGDVGPSGTAQSKNSSLRDLIFSQDVTLGPVPDSVAVVVTLRPDHQMIETDAMPRVARSMANHLTLSQWSMYSDPCVDVGPDVLPLEPEVGVASTGKGTNPEMAVA